jgi:hypothetical protein
MSENEKVSRDVGVKWKWRNDKILREVGVNSYGDMTKKNWEFKEKLEWI